MCNCCLLKLEIEPSISAVVLTEFSTSHQDFEAEAQAILDGRSPKIKVQFPQQ